MSCIQCASDESQQCASDKSQPPLTEAILPPLSKSERGLLARVSDHLSDIAASLDVPPEILMPKADLEQLIRQHEQPTSVTPEAWSGWRNALVVEPLKQWLRNEVGV